jgi:hypothetical protein
MSLGRHQTRATNQHGRREINHADAWARRITEELYPTDPLVIDDPATIAWLRTQPWFQQDTEHNFRTEVQREFEQWQATEIQSRLTPREHDGKVDEVNLHHSMPAANPQPDKVLYEEPRR